MPDSTLQLTDAHGISAADSDCTCHDWFALPASSHDLIVSSLAANNSVGMFRLIEHFELAKDNEECTLSPVDLEDFVHRHNWDHPLEVSFVAAFIGDAFWNREARNHWARRFDMIRCILDEKAWPLRDPQSGHL